MRNRTLTQTLCLFFFCSSILLTAQSKSQLEQQRDQLLRDIKYTNSMLAASKENQGEAVERIATLKKKVSLQKRLINTIDKEALALQREMNRNKEQISTLEQELEDLKKEYAKLVYMSYKNQCTDDKLLYLFASDNLYQAWMRMAHLKELAKYQERQGELIVKSKEEVVAKNKEVTAQKQEKLVLLDEQKKAKADLDKDKANVQKLLDGLKANEQDLKDQLKKQQQERKKLNQAIEKVIRDEMRKAENNTTGSFALTPAEALSSKTFSKNKGKLPWPVEKGVVVDHFGTHPHPVIAGVEVTNNGIDIATEKLADARAIFEGEVTGIINIPGAGMAVVVKHGGYRTVYSNLKEVFVEKGNIIETKQVVGILLPEGNQSKAHLEVWQITSDGMKKLNPESWIAR